MKYETEHGSYEMPELTYKGLSRYVTHHVSPGSFLRAVLSNDLLSSFLIADDYNAIAMYDIVKFCYLELPHSCWGSQGVVDKWIANEEAKND